LKHLPRRASAVIFIQNDHHDGPGHIYVYYCRTYEKAVSGGGEGKRRTCAKGHYQPRPVRSSGHLTRLSGAGEGEVVSKKVGKEVRGAQG
jgi:hypothetical protein